MFFKGLGLFQVPGFGIVQGLCVIRGLWIIQTLKMWDLGLVRVQGYGFRV